MTQDEIIAAIEQITRHLPLGETTIGLNVYTYQFNRYPNRTGTYSNNLQGPGWSCRYEDTYDNQDSAHFPTGRMVIQPDTLQFEETDPGAFERDLVFILMALA